MKLLVDLGNSGLKWAWLEDRELQAPGHALHGGRADVAAALAGSGRRPDEVLLASVAAPALTEEVLERIRSLWPVPVRQARTEASGGGVRNGYLEPAQMGVDRWLAMVAAYDRHRAAVCVVDAGTALTVDLVEADGAHAGGLILPGRALMRSALLRQTGRIAVAAALEAGTDPGGLLGRDTESCIRWAALRASVSLVESCVRDSARTGGQAATVVVTGGDAPALLRVLAVPAEHRPLLVLEGLALRLAAAGGAP